MSSILPDADPGNLLFGLAAAPGNAVLRVEFPLSVEAAADGRTVQSVGKGVRRLIRCRQLIAYAGYPIDIHRLGGGTLERLPKGVVPTIPLRALVPKGSRNLMVAGRSISSDRAASSGLRVQGTCMAMGQAAGAAAALAAQSGKSPLEVPLDAIKVLLRKHHAIVPG